jgi:hypothetical protein
MNDEITIRGLGDLMRLRGELNGDDPAKLDLTIQTGGRVFEGTILAWKWDEAGWIYQLRDEHGKEMEGYGSGAVVNHFDAALLSLVLSAIEASRGTLEEARRYHEKEAITASN